jgi:hypothetical protein
VTTTGKVARARSFVPSRQNSAGLQLRRPVKSDQPSARQRQPSVVEGRVVAGGQAQGAAAAGRGSNRRCLACGASNKLDGVVRFGVLESPMCKDCVEGLSAVQSFLKRLMKK